MGIKNAEDYHHVLKYFPPAEAPAFEREEMMKLVWGKRWGCNSEVGKLKTVLMRSGTMSMRAARMFLSDLEVTSRGRTPGW